MKYPSEIQSLRFEKYWRELLDAGHPYDIVIDKYALRKLRFVSIKLRFKTE
jgi:hypothetical protein